MSEFKQFSTAVNTAFQRMTTENANQLFVADVTGDALWEHYIKSFPSGTNPMFREKTEHDCSTCRNFVKHLGPVIFVSDKETKTVWDISLDDEVYSVVAKAMAEFVKSKGIKHSFFVSEAQYGVEKTSSGTEVWHHFGAKVPRQFQLRNNPNNVINNKVDDKLIFQRGLESFTADAINTVSELIKENNLYRGEEHKRTVEFIKEQKQKYDTLKTDDQKVRFLWLTSAALGGVARFRNTVIGTLIGDLSDGVGVEDAVKSFESKTAPANYKRPKALVTQKMIDNAKKTVEELGIEDSLFRRYATREDISVNNVLFVDGAVKPLLVGGAFDSVKPTKKKEVVKEKVDEVSFVSFIRDILPKTSELEIMLEGSHLGNFVSLIAPVHAESKKLFKWDNGFSWSYDGDFTDSIKERVKKAGGKVDGYGRISLSWHNGDDLDLHLTRIVPNKRYSEEIYFGHKRAFGATLDVDMNAGGIHNSTDPVENIVWNNRQDMTDGEYHIVVDQFNKRSSSNIGFEVEVEVNGELYTFENPHGAKKHEKVGVLVVKNGEIVSLNGFKKGHSSAEKWGVKTNEWAKVDLVTLSPNFWDGIEKGNRHLFFMLRDCKNPNDARGFYNEFLRDDLNQHKKVFETLAGSLKAVYSDNQLSGVGFSSTKRDEVMIHVKGSVNRIVKLKF